MGFKDEKFYKFSEGVLSEKLNYGSLIKLSVDRFYNDLDNSAYYFDYEKGKRVVDFIEKFCRHWKGSWKGKPMILEPHQHFQIIQQFGWVDDDGLRRFRSGYEEVARKNGKTTKKAAVALFAISKDGEYGAQVYCGATKEEQARILVNDSGQIVKASPHLRRKFKTFESRGMVSRVVYPDSNSFIAPMGRDSNTQDGTDVHFGFIDEYHEHKTPGTLNVLESGMGSRTQPFLDIITTAGFNKQYPCYNETRKTGIEILKGIKDDERQLIMIFSLDEDDEWEDEEKWIKANPSLGASLSMDFLRSRYVKAKNEGNTKEVDFKTKNLNMWTDAASVWIRDGDWMKNSDKPNATDVKKWFGGLDLSSTQDLSALVLESEPDIDGVFSVIPFFFLPIETAKLRTKTDGVPYMQWISEGYLIATPGNAIDYNFIENKIMELMSSMNIISIEFDRWNSTQLVHNLVNEGVPMSPFGQGYKDMSTPTKELERISISGKYRHGGNPVLRWMCSNVEIQTDPAGNIKIDKSKSSEKVDGMVALAMAHGGYLTHVGNSGGITPGIDVW